MKVYTEIALKEFEFWDYAEEWTQYLTDEEFDELENYLYDETNYLNKTAINDDFTFEADSIVTLLGYKDVDEFLAERRGN